MLMAGICAPAAAGVPPVQLRVISPTSSVVPSDLRVGVTDTFVEQETAPEAFWIASRIRYRKASFIDGPPKGRTSIHGQRVLAAGAKQQLGKVKKSAKQRFLAVASRCGR